MTLRSAAFWLLAGYVVARVILGALLNPPLNGPDEGGHVEYLRTLIDAGLGHVTGVEARQPPTYYLLAALPWLAADRHGANVQLFFVRLLGAACGAVTLAAAWAAARMAWPSRPQLAFATAAMAVLAPGHLFLLASVNNDVLAVACASVAVVAALHLWQEASAALGEVTASREGGPSLSSGRQVGSTSAPGGHDHGGRRWWLAVWVLASALAVGTKLTTAPVVGALAAGLALRWRGTLLRPIWVRVVTGGGAIALLGGYALLVTRSPTSSLAAAAARFWPLAAVRAPGAFIARGGLAESFRTFWYAYDYAVRWPRLVEALLAGSAVAVSLVAALGLALERPLPGLVWLAAGVQIVLVVGRYGLGELLQIAMGGAGQAKGFFPALVPLALLFVAGLDVVLRRLRVRDDRWLALGTFAWLLGLDAVSLAWTTWQQYRWWQVVT